MEVDPLVSLLIMNDHFNQIAWIPGLLQGYAFAYSNPITGFDFTASAVLLPGG